MRKSYVKLLMSALMLLVVCALPNPAFAFGQKELQQMLDIPASVGVRGTTASTANEIDLSELSEPITSTLYVRNSSVRFVNGTLTQDKSFTGTLIEIKNGYTLELSSTATLSGNNVKSDNPLVLVSSGSLYIDGGSITNVYGGSRKVLGLINYTPTPDATMNTAVYVNDRSTLYVMSGQVTGQISNSGIEAYMYIDGGTVDRIATNISFYLSGSAKIVSDVSLMSNRASIALNSALQYNLTISNYHKDQAIVVAAFLGDKFIKKGHGYYTITSSDVEKIVLYKNTYNYVLELEDNAVYVREGLGPIATIEDVEPGTLPERIPENYRDIIEELTITGRLNGTDFNILRDMATNRKLRVLDISGATIVSGGESYLTNNGKKYYTNNYEFGFALFSGCKIIEKMVLPDNLVTIGQSAFWYCSRLKTLVIGSKVTKIGPGLWGGCGVLSDVKLGTSNFHLVGGILYNKDYTTIIAALLTATYGDLTIRSGVKEIQYNAFAFCTSLTSVKFPSSVTTIGDTSFAYTNISSVTLTSNVTSIGSYAFSGCKYLKSMDLTMLKITTLSYGLFTTSGLEEVYLPSTITTLEASVFSTTPLKNIYLKSINPPSMQDFGSSSATFYEVDTETCIVHVPAGRVSVYKSATGWKRFFNITDDKVDTDNIKTEEDLQKALDYIAEQKPTEPVEVRIAEEGITLTKDIDVKEYCNAIITGGTINIRKFGGYEAVFLLYSNSRLSFRDITIDFHNNVINTYCFWVHHGSVLTIDKNVEYANINEDVTKSRASFYCNSGECYLYSGKLPTINEFTITNGMGDFSGSVYLNGSLFEQAKIYNTAESMIYILSPITGVWTFDGIWTEYELEKPFIKGAQKYTMQASDYWQLLFLNLPIVDTDVDCNGVTYYYDGVKDYAIKLKNYKDAQCVLDQAGKDVDVPCEGIDAIADVNLKAQILLDGTKCLEPFLPEWRLPGGCLFINTIDLPIQEPTEFKDIQFNSYSSGHRVYVRRKVDFKQNIIARNFIVFSIIEKGGHLIWRDATAENVQYPIYNDGGSVEIIGGNLSGKLYNINDGEMRITGSTVVEVIRNEARLWLGSTKRIPVVEMKRKARIKLLCKLAGKLKFLFYSDGSEEKYNRSEDMPEDGDIIVEGTEDYQPTPEDVENIDTSDWPGNFIPELDDKGHIVIHDLSAGIHEITADRKIDNHVYDMLGRRVTRTISGHVYYQSGKKFIAK